MPDPIPRMPAYRSVFFKLPATMLAMALVIMVMVGLFLTLVFTPSLGASIHPLIERSTELVAATAPDLETARRLAEQLDLELRFEGPEESWTTSDDLPTITFVREARDGGEIHSAPWRRRS